MRYFFDFCANGVETRDVDGVDLPDLERAKQEAFRALASIAKEECAPASAANFAIAIRTEAGVCLSRVAARFTIDEVAAPLRASGIASN
ncbi:MAG: hypothetical protein JO346_06795 [Alphaproteobacteria bacterium]|nr:hypothetical protein [Alphaproteobacteria bacterium]